MGTRTAARAAGDALALGGGGDAMRGGDDVGTSNMGSTGGGDGDAGRVLGCDDAADAVSGGAPGVRIGTAVPTLDNARASDLGLSLADEMVATCCVGDVGLLPIRRTCAGGVDALSNAALSGGRRGGSCIDVDVYSCVGGGVVISCTICCHNGSFLKRR